MGSCLSPRFMAAAPTLTEDLEEEVLLRLPPHEPALLVHAALVCRRWRRLVSGPAFRRRFRERHRTPPMLGFVCNFTEDGGTDSFVTSVDFCSEAADLGLCRALDARHGRVLLQRPGRSGDALVVWDPITDDRQKLPLPPRLGFRWSAAVLCAAGACDHLDCHRGPFLVVLVSGSGEAFICTYSSDAGTWSRSDPIAMELPHDFANFMPSVLVGNALYFGLSVTKALVKYDLESQEMSKIGLPFRCLSWRHVAVDGELGLAAICGSKLCMWKNASPEGDAGWTQNRVIELETLLPMKDPISPVVVGFADGSSVIFLVAGPALYTIDLKTCKTTKVYMCRRRHILSVVPYMSFYTPALEMQHLLKDEASVP